MKRRAAIVKAAKGATTVRPLIGPFLRYCGEVGFEISEMPSGERGTERRPPISVIGKPSERRVSVRVSSGAEADVVSCNGSTSLDGKMGRCD